MRAFAFLILLFALAACDSNAIDSLYPAPGGYPQLRVESLLTVEAGRYNVEGYLERIICEDDTPNDCIPGTNWLFESLAEDPPQQAALLSAHAPDAFRERVRYRLSIETTQEIGGPLRVFRVIGAARLD